MAGNIKKLQAHLGDPALTQRTVQKQFAQFHSGHLRGEDDFKSTSAS